MLYNSVSWKVLIFASQISFTSHYEVTTCSDNELVLNKILAHWLYAKKNTAYGWLWWFYGKTVVLKESRFSFQYHQTAKLLISRNTSGFINTRARSCQSYYGQRFPLASFGPKEPLPLKALHCQLCWFTSSRFLFTTKTPAFPRTDRAVGGFSLCFFRIHSYLPFSLLCPASSPSQAPALPHLILPEQEDLSTRTQASNVSLPFRGALMLSPTERSQPILAARAVQVSPVRAHIPAATQTHSHPAPPSPLNTLCSPQSCQSFAQGQLPSSQVYLSLPQLFLFSKALILIHLPDKILPMPPGTISLSGKLMCHCLLESKSYSVWH